MTLYRTNQARNRAKPVRAAALLALGALLAVLVACAPNAGGPPAQPERTSPQNLAVALAAATPEATPTRPAGPALPDESPAVVAATTPFSSPNQPESTPAPQISEAPPPTEPSPAAVPAVGGVSASASPQTGPVSAQSGAPAQSTDPAPALSKPVRLQISTENVQVDAAIEYVGLNESGNMAVPEQWQNVAWFERGTLPGRPGNAVIAGHLDSPTGPAVFWNLGRLKPGDIVLVVAANGDETRFVVRTLDVYEADNAPLLDIFGPAETPRLNLITCDGVFDQATRQYDRRLVVYTEKVEG